MDQVLLVLVGETSSQFYQLLPLLNALTA